MLNTKTNELQHPVTNKANPQAKSTLFNVCEAQQQYAATAAAAAAKHVHKESCAIHEKNKTHRGRKTNQHQLQHQQDSISRTFEVMDEDF